ncbi:hypothetical protein ACF0H5_006690 [Mactra antiquata]
MPHIQLLSLHLILYNSIEKSTKCRTTVVFISYVIFILFYIYRMNEMLTPLITNQTMTNISMSDSMLSVLASIHPNLTSEFLALSPEEQQQFLESLSIQSEEISHLNHHDLLEYRIHKALSLYLPPFFLIMGTFGNVFSFLILRNKTMTRQSTNLFLAALALADSIVLYVGLLRRWVADISGVELQSETNWLCRTVSVLAYSSSHFSVWLIIAVTIERYIAVSHPLQASRFCNLSRAKRVIGLLALLLVGCNLHFLWTVELKSNSDGSIVYCDAADDVRYLVTTIWPWVDATLYALAPFLLIAVFNTLIIRQTIKATSWRDELQKGPLINIEKRKMAKDNNLKLTIMLLSVSFTFLITTFPMAIVMVFHNKWASDINDPSITIHVVTQRRLIRTIAEMLMFLNHSINFYLYCALGQKFRNQVLKTLCGRTMSNNSNASDHSQHLYCSRVNGYHLHKSADETNL